ncbi:MAG: DMT family transporter [Oscillospiraceae bacterium]|nr:DMT family transporter [Oscillospiraceae bacterium]
MHNKYKGPLFMAAASVCWSFGGICIKFIPWGAMSIVGLRALLAMAVFAVYRRSVKVSFTFGNIIAALCLSATTILFVFANKMTTAAAAILLQFSAPVFIILLQAVFYKKKPKLAETAAVSATVAGMLLFFADRLGGGGGLAGNIFAIASGLSFAGVFVCNQRQDVNPEQALFLGFVINSAIGLPFVFFEVTANPAAWIAVVFLGVVQVGLAYVFFSVGIKITPALPACLITAVEPVLNPVWVALATGEMPGPFAAAGGAVIVLTVIGYNVWAEKHRESK